MEKQALFWIFIGIFTITAFITLLGITGVIKTIKERYLNALFGALILEVVAAVLMMFRGTNFTESTLDPQPLLQKAGAAMTPGVDADSLILSLIREGRTVPELKNRIRTLDSTLLARDQELSRFKGELDAIDRNFLAKVIRLRNLIPRYGDWVNIAYRPDDKEDVYILLAQIFSVLEPDQPLFADEQQTVVNKQVVRNAYARFRRRYAPADPGKLYLFNSDTVEMVRAYLQLLASQSGGESQLTG